VSARHADALHQAEPHGRRAARRAAVSATASGVSAGTHDGPVLRRGPMGELPGARRAHRRPAVSSGGQHSRLGPVHDEEAIAPRTLLIATTNDGKTREIREILAGLPFD